MWRIGVGACFVRRDGLAPERPGSWINRAMNVEARTISAVIALVVVLTVAGCAGFGTGRVIRDTRSKLVVYSGDKFTVAMPGTPRESMQRVPTAVGRQFFHLLEVDEGHNGSFGVGYFDYPRGTQIRIEGAVRGSANGVGGRAVNVKRITYRHAEGRDFRVIGIPAGTGFVRVVLVGRRLYELLVVVPETGATFPPADFASMLRSFRFRAPNAVGRGTTRIPTITDVDFAQVKAGDCYNNPSGGTVDTLPELPCRQPHDAEVFFVYTMPAGRYPGDDAVDASADHTCGHRFARIGYQHLTGPFDYDYFTPARDAWKAGDRSTQCALIRADGQKLHGRHAIR